MQRFQVILVMALPLLCMNGCLSTLIGKRDVKSKDYTLKSPGPEWESIDPAEADAAFRNKKDQAILNVSSLCGEDSYRPLEDLTEDVLKQLPQHSLIEPPKTTTVGGHPGLITEAKGTVDGEPLEVRIAVVRTSRCVFDFLLAGSRLEDSSRKAFEQALAQFTESRVR